MHREQLRISRKLIYCLKRYDVLLMPQRRLSPNDAKTKGESDVQTRNIAGMEACRPDNVLSLSFYCQPMFRDASSSRKPGSIEKVFRGPNLHLAYPNAFLRSRAREDDVWIGSTGKAILIEVSVWSRMRVNLAVKLPFCSEELMLDGTSNSHLTSLSLELDPFIPSLAHGWQNSAACPSRT